MKGRKSLKKCTKCKRDLSLSNFTLDRQRKDGLYPSCKECRAKYAKEYRSKNREKLIKRSRKYREDNLEEIRRKDRERSKEPKRRAYKNARNRYHLIKKRSLGKAYMNDVEVIYGVARYLSEVKEEEFHVDHIVPLQGKAVCGLHVPWNLQILTAEENLSKRNLLIINQKMNKS